MRTASTFLFALFVLAGCGGSGNTTVDAAMPGNPACEEIIERCHELDIGTGEIHECHEGAEAEDATNESCLALQAHCFEVCVASDGGVEGDAGEHAHDEDGGH